jgi:hypothetical protein
VIVTAIVDASRRESLMPWSGWRKIADGFAISAAVHEAPGRLHLFAVNGAGKAFHRGDYSDDRWVEFTTPHGWSWGFSGASMSPGRLDVVTNSNAEPQHSLRAGGVEGGYWLNWAPLGGIIAFAPVIDSERPGQLNMFAVGRDLAMFHRWNVNTQWSGWESLGGDSFTWGPAACTWGAGRQDVFCARAGGYNNSVWHKGFQNGWSGWENLGGFTLTRPAACSWGPGRIDLFISGGDRAVHHRFYENGRWTNWDPEGSLGGIVHGDHPSIAASAGNGGPMRVYHTGTDLAIYENWWM